MDRKQLRDFLTESLGSSDFQNAQSRKYNPKDKKYQKIMKR